MLSRRDLVRNGLLLSTAGGLAPILATAEPMPAGVWVIDSRLHAAPEVVSAAATRGAEALTFAADPGPVWMNLAPRLKRGPFAIGGYTNAPVLFCLHYLARDYGLRLAGLGDGMSLPEPVAGASDSLVDLRDPRFNDQRTAYTWLMLPRSA